MPYGDAKLMIRPPRSRMCGNAACIAQNVPRNPVSNVQSSSASSNDSSGVGTGRPVGWSRVPQDWALLTKDVEAPVGLNDEPHHVDDVGLSADVGGLRDRGATGRLDASTAAAHPCAEREATTT